MCKYMMNMTATEGVALSGALDPLELVPDDLLQHSIEGCLERWGTSVRTERQSRSFPLFMMQTPAGCADLLKAMIDATVQSLCGDKVLLQDLHFRTYIRSALALTPHNGATTTNPTAGKKGVASDGASTICSYDLLAQLKVKAESAKLVVCTRGAACQRNTRIYPPFPRRIPPPLLNGYRRFCKWRR